jgi:ribosomal protein uS7
MNVFLVAVSVFSEVSKCLCVLQDYIAVKEKYAKYLPHSAGRYQAKRFRKAQCPIVERLTDSLMMHGRNNGKKLMAMRIVKHSFEIIHLLTGEVGNSDGIKVFMVA